MNILFVCSRNQWRSPTAEQIWRDHPGLVVHSRGVSPNARRSISEDDLQWADIIFVMEDRHKSRIQSQFGRWIANKPIHVLDIPDDYTFMQPELVEELRRSVRAIPELESLHL